MNHQNNLQQLILIFFIFIQLTCFCQFSAAQTQYGRIIGTVADEQQHPLFNVNIVVENTTIGTASDERGVFTLNIVPGTYSVKFSSIGYHNVTKTNVIVIQGTDTKLQIVLAEEILKMQEIVVTPGNFSISQEQTANTQAIQKNRIQSMPGSIDDICRVIQIMPGIAVSDDYSAHFHVRGGKQSENLILLDGMEIFDPYHLKHIGGAVGVMNMDIINDVTILTGGFPAKYGDKLSSVVTVNNRNGNSKKFSGMVGGGGTGAKALLEGPIPGGSFLLSWRKSFLTQAAEILNPTDYAYSPSFYDVQGRIALASNSNNQFYINVLYSKDDTYLEKWRHDSDLYSDYGNGYYGVIWKLIINPDIYSETIISDGQNFWDNRIGADKSEKLRLTEYACNWNLNVNSLANNNVEFGLTYKRIIYDYKLNVADVSVDQQHLEDIIESYYGDSNILQRTYKTSAYLQDRIRIWHSLIANAGIRYDYFEYNRDHQWSPRLGLAYSIAGNTILRCAWGYFFQSPVYTELTSVKGKDVNPQAEQATHYVLGIEHFLTNNINIRVEGYNKSLRQMIGHYIDFEDSSDTPQLHYGNPNSGRCMGVEFFVNGAWSQRLDFWLSYAYSKTRIEAYVVNWDALKVEQKEIPRFTDQPHNLTLYLEYRLPRDWELSVKWRYLSGVPYTPKYEVWNNPSTPRWKSGEIYSARYPAYHRLDVRIGKSFPLTWSTISAFLEIKNIYNRKNVFLYDYEIVNGRHERTAYHMLPFLPTLEFTISF